MLKADSKAIFTASSKAQQACDWMISHAGESASVSRGGGMSFDTLAGIYVYAMDHHTGQGSRLYRIGSRIGSIMRLTDGAINAIRHGRDDRGNEWEVARCVYRRLKRRKARCQR